MNPEKQFPIPVYKVTGSSPREMGEKIGSNFRDRIRGAYRARRSWIDRLKTFAMADRKNRFDAFLDVVRERAPGPLSELEGLAGGAGVDFTDAFCVATNPELSALLKSEKREGGCTTAGVRAGNKLWIGHNEDGNKGLDGLLYILDAAFPSGVEVVCLSYPGYPPGNGPCLNSAGLAHTVNYIGGREVKVGLPRYFVDRLVMEARSVDEAVGIVTSPGLAYSQHHLIASAREGRMVSVETGPSKHSVIEVEGIFVHANHYVHPVMKDVPQFDFYEGSSAPRQERAEKWRDSIDDPALVTPEDVTGLLASHQDGPMSVCRHPKPDAAGATLASVLIVAEKGKIRVHAGRPCESGAIEIPWPGQ